MKKLILLIIFSTFLVSNVLTQETGQFTDTRNDHKYKTVKIGDQVWMAENLAYLPSVVGSSYGAELHPYYYVYLYEGSDVAAAKASDNFKKYGVLYNWVAAKTACPKGWHLPSDEEWKTLEKHLGMSELDADDTAWRNSSDVGKKLKSTPGLASSGNGDYSSGFNALLGGYRRHHDGEFTRLDKLAYFWCSSRYGPIEPWCRYLLYGYDGVGRDYEDRRNGFSVRCIMD